MGDWRGVGDGQLRDVIAAVRSKDQELARQRSQIELLTRRAALAENEKRVAQQQVEEAKSAVAERNREVHRLTENIESMKNQVDRLSAEQRSRENTLAAAETSLEKLKAAGLTEKERYAKTLMDLNIAFRSKLSSINQTDEFPVHLNKVCQEKESCPISAPAENNDNYETMKMHAEVVEKNNIDIDATIKKMREEAATSLQTLSIKEKEIESLRSQISGLQENLVQKKEALQKLKIENEQLRAFQTQMDEYATSLEQRLEALQVGECAVPPEIEPSSSTQD